MNSVVIPSEASWVNEESRLAQSRDPVFRLGRLEQKRLSFDDPGSTAWVPRMTAFSIRPEALRDGEFIAFVKPDRPPEVRFVVRNIDRSKLTSTSGEDVLVFSPRFELKAGFHGIADVVDDPVHDIKIEAEDNDFRMLVTMEKAGGIREFWSRFTSGSENFRDDPTMALDVGKEFLFRS